MKEIIFAIVLALGVLPVMADELQQASSGQAIQQWQGFWSTNSIDPANHVVWKLYVFRAIPQRENPNADKDYIIAGLTPYSKNSYYVRIKIDLLYNYFKPAPGRGDVIVVSGRVISRRDYLLDLKTKEVPIKLLTMQLDGAAKVPGEHFNPAVIPEDSAPVTTAFTPTPPADSGSVTTAFTPTPGS
jgi:hypothetical protein